MIFKITGIIFIFFTRYVPDLSASVKDIEGMNNSPYIYIIIMIIISLNIAIIFILGNAIRKKNIELKTAKVKLDIAENKVNTLLLAIPDFIFIIEDEYNFLDYKAEVEDDLYVPPSEFIGRKIYEVLPPRLANITVTKIDAIRQTGLMQTYNYELEVHGEKLQFNARIIRLTDERYLIISRNISEKKKREEEETKSHKLESIGFFAGGLAHDFNNILSAIVGYISLARMKIDNRAKTLELLEEAEKETLSARKLTEQLLIFSKNGGPVRVYADIKDIVSESADFIMSGSKTALKYDFTVDELSVNVDRNQIGQVIQNIVLNASQAMNLSGTVEVKIYRKFLEKSNHLSLAEGDYAVIEIHDHGPGIEKKNLRRIFEPYFTTKSDSNGLGLTICRNIIDNHGGAIDVKSEQEEGTTFTVYLPLCNSIVTGLCEEATAGSPGNLSGLSVIIMDDEPQLRFIMQQVLEDEGAEIFLAEEGGEAIEIFEKMTTAGRSPDLIIADLTIPGGMGGMEAVRIIREQGVAFKAIVISGYSNDPVISDYQGYGFDACLVKPFTSNELLATVKKVC
jgi:signal transduction histidine kinase